MIIPQISVVENVNFPVGSVPEIHHISDFAQNILTFVFSGCIVICVTISGLLILQ